MTFGAMPTMHEQDVSIHTRDWSLVTNPNQHMFRLILTNISSIPLEGIEGPDTQNNGSHWHDKR